MRKSMERRGCHIAETTYDVLRFIDHGRKSRAVMDTVPGKLLIYSIRDDPVIEKKVLFEWMRQLLWQLEQYYRCQNGQCYRCLNPYSILVTQRKSLLLLDLTSADNEFVLRNMQKRAMREHFVKPLAHRKENSKISVDLYGFGKTIQFILANAKAEPSLTKIQERKLEKIIAKCLCENPKKQYEEWKQIYPEIPLVREQNLTITNKVRIFAAAASVVFVVVLAGVCLLATARMRLKEDVSRREISALKETGEREASVKKPDRLDQLAEEADSLGELLPENSSKDNREIISRGEQIRTELLRYLAAAYDREGMEEKALAMYEELCEADIQEAYLETAFGRRLALEAKAQNAEKIVQTGQEALKKLPGSRKTALAYLEALYQCEEIPGAVRREEIASIKEQFPGIERSEEYRQIEEDYYRSEGGNADEKSMENAGSMGKPPAAFADIAGGSQPALICG